MAILDSSFSSTIVLLTLASAISSAQQTYSFTGAIWVQTATASASWAPSYTSAVPAVCPASHPESCSSIGEDDYCCPSNTYCAWSDNRVPACCASGETCSGSISSASASAGAYEPSSSWSSSSSWQQPPSSSTTPNYWNPPATSPTSVVYVGPGGGTHQSTATVYTTTATAASFSQQPVEPQSVATTTTAEAAAAAAYGDYCSTLFATGPGLPTTQAGQCGTILIEEPSGAARAVGPGWGVLVLTVAVVVGGGQILGLGGGRRWRRI